jgi:hypothetical protein
VPSVSKIASVVLSQSYSGARDSADKISAEDVLRSGFPKIQHSVVLLGWHPFSTR